MAERRHAIIRSTLERRTAGDVSQCILTRGLQNPGIRETREMRDV